MRYYSVQLRKLDLTKVERREIERKLTALDRVILVKTRKGEDIVGIIACGKPYVNKFGAKEFADTDRVLKAVDKLCKLNLLEVR